MSVLILSKNPAQKRLLEDALQQAKLVLVQEGGSPELAVFYDIDDKITDILSQLRCPLISIGKNKGNIEVIEDITMPIRLGYVIDRIKHHLKIIAMKQNKRLINIGDMTLNLQEGSLTKKGRDSITLTEKEIMILAFLAQAKEKSVSRQTLLDEVWGYASTVETHTLETHIYRLRQKIEDDPSTPAIVITKEDGYCLNS